MSLRLGGDSAVASKALGSPMSSSFTFRTVLPRGQRWKEQSLLRNNEISKLVNDHMTSVLDREAKKEKEGQEKEEKGQGSGRDRRRERGARETHGKAAAPHWDRRAQRRLPGQPCPQPAGRERGCWQRHLRPAQGAWGSGGESRRCHRDSLGRRRFLESELPNTENIVTQTV